MTNKDLLNAFNSIDQDIIDEAAPRSRVITVKRYWYSLVAAVATVAIVFTVGATTDFWKPLFGLGVGPDVEPNDDPNPEEEYALKLPVPWEDMVTGTNSENSDSSDAFATWEGFEVSYHLYDALNRSDNNDQYFALTISRQGYSLEDFSYAGMTVAEYEEFYESINEKRDYRWNKLLDFEKVGLWLCWGEVLYTTGIPEDVPYLGGDKWSEELYLEKVAFYGQEMIDTYTDGHTLLLDKLQADGAALEAEIEADEALAEEWRRAYSESENYQTYEELRDKGYHVFHIGRTTYLFVTKEELKHLDVDHSDYSLNFANRNPLEDEPADEPDVLLPDPDVVE